MKTIILLLFLTLSVGVFAQDISQSEFQNSEWFSETNGETLFKTDSLKISKIVNFNSEQNSDLLPFLKLNFLKTKLISTLEFNDNDLRIEEIDTEWCGFNFSGQFTWKFDNNKQSLSLYREEKLIAEYRINTNKTELTKWNNNSTENFIELKAEIMTLELSKLKNN